ncbi:response regulator [Muriicola sp. Z0-33]|uniref:response regulator n=1 Tax=Muriicola sp. Z0-33 TaxID=2816957 RepID=UPI0022378048|nr:response regulator [Muriicola sp. Z0-33]MCW5517523.1 response regulator [Muriicola sp. Z0-33]
MKQAIDCILLVDDDSPTNFIHETLLKQFVGPKEIVSVENGLKALEYLQSGDKGYFPKPDLILLDINMPVMNGWKFLENYQLLEKSQQAAKLILMLTAPLSPEQMSKARANPLIDGFMNKPLNTAMVKKLYKQYFDR